MSESLERTRREKERRQPRVQAESTRERLALWKRMSTSSPEPGNVDKPETDWSGGTMPRDQPRGLGRLRESKGMAVLSGDGSGGA